MKKATSKLLLFFFCMSFLMVIPKKVNAAEIIPVNISVKYGQTEGRKIFDMINEMRTDSFDAWCWNEDNETKTRYDNLNELAYDYDLERIATKRAAELALLFDHGRPNGESFFSIYEEEGITYRAAGENIAMGYRTAEAVNAAWREDGEPYNGQGHRRNMLNPKFNCVGIGHVYLDGCHYWVEEFAYRTSVNTTETTANDSEQTMSLSVPKSKVTGLKVAFDKTSYSLRTGESTEVKLTAKLTVFGSDTIVTDLPAISVNDPSIATYSNGKITGVAEGSTTLTASLYGLTAADMPTINVYRCEHHWDQGEIITEATCTEEGEKKFTCSICGDEKTEKVSATGHQHTEIRNKKEATCKETGYSGDTWCKDCGKKILSGQTIAKTENHSWDAGKVTTKATCTEEGEKTFTCSICGDEKTEKVSATGHQHTEIRNKKEATCKETGYSGDTWCKDCGKKILSGQTIAKTENHSWTQGEITKEPTCKEEGEKTFTCSICGNIKTEKVSTADHQHMEIRNQKNPTCKEAGYSGDTYCADCGVKIFSGQTIAKTKNHNWDGGVITTEPTCTERGEKTFTCTICGNTNTKKVNATGHRYGAYKVVKEPTNKRKGLKSKTCSVCGKIVYEAIPKTNFSPTDSSETNPDQNPQTSQKTTRKIKLEIGQEYPHVEVEVIPGVTAANGGAAVLGAPLIHDFAVISLSDLLTPWEKIEKRLLCASEADFVICLYNPSSKKRHDYLQKACDLMMRSKDPDTVCGTVSNIGREGEMFRVMTLKELRDTRVDMFTTVYIGNSQTKMLNGKMVTPRGYIHG